MSGTVCAIGQRMRQAASPSSLGMISTKQSHEVISTSLGPRSFFVHQDSYRVQVGIVESGKIVQAVNKIRSVLLP